ncbi:C-X-C chemokine receptor type 3-like [Notechis scutatus]|uniref:C-X-C chemokine receptor type 3 n=1 Tax=Notechis scutatus TaxID=8663 RepID=A0A6J1VND5_9SAUR|nr:C-X-C chemokine receptor type 3-like [Notechis scutatus]
MDEDHIMSYSGAVTDDYNESYSFDCCLTQPCDLIPYQEFSRWFLPPFYYLIFLLGLGGNLMVIAVLLLDRAPLLGTDIFVFNLAIADILLVVTLPFWAIQAIRGWVFKDFPCKVVGSMLKINFYASALFLICISFERYLSIVYVIRMYNRNKRFIIYTTLLVWFVCFLMTVPDFVYLTAEFDSRLNVTSCGLVFPQHSTKMWKIALIIINQVVAFLLPLVAMIYCYFHIILTLLHSKGFRKHRALKVILAVVVAFFLCWSPYHLVQFINTLLQLQLLEKDCQWEDNLDIADIVTTSLGFFHCCLNPLLYAFVGLKFRNKLLMVLKRLGCINQNFWNRHFRVSGQSRDSSWSESTDCSNNIL